MKKHIPILGLAILLAVSCGDDKKKAQEEEGGFQMSRAKESEPEAVDENVIALSSNDLMKYDKAELRVTAGKKVTLTLRHTGTMDKNVMGHNFVLLAQGTNVVEFATQAATLRDSEYIPTGSEAIIAHTKLIGGGETTTITFDAPPAGTYDFICSFPGHYAMMQGKFIVE